MNKILISILLVLLFILYQSFQKNDTYVNLKKLSGSNSTIIYNNVKQGYFERTMFEIIYYSAIDLNFNIIQNHPGKYSPSVDITIYDISREKHIKLSYISLKGKEYLNLQVRVNNKVDLNEDIVINNKIEKMKISWKDNNIYLNAGEFNHVMNIPFEPSLIGVSNYSIEILNKITLIEKNENENE